MQNQEPSVSDLLELISTSSELVVFRKPYKLQRINWCFFTLAVPENVDIFPVLSSFCENEFKKTKVSLRYFFFINENLKHYVAVVAKEEETPFCKIIQVPPALLSNIRFYVPKANSDALQAALTSLSPVFQLPPSSTELSRITASEIITGDLVTATLNGRIGMQSFANISTAKERMLALMRQELKDANKTRLLPNDIIPTFWGLKFLYLPLQTKKRNFWIFGDSNVGKSMFSRMVNKRFLSGNISAGSPTHPEITPQTQIIIIDEFKLSNMFTFPQLNLLCDNSFYFKHLYANNFRTVEAIVMVLANQSLRKTYPMKNDINEDVWEQLENRFIEVDVNSELAAQGIKTADYRTGMYKVSDETRASFYEQDIVDTWSNDAVLEKFTASKGTFEAEICTQCGNRIGFVNSSANKTLLREAGSVNRDLENEFAGIEEEAKEGNVTLDLGGSSIFNENPSRPAKKDNSFESRKEGIIVGEFDKLPSESEAIEDGEAREENELVEYSLMSMQSSNNLSLVVDGLVRRSNEIRAEADGASTETLMRLQEEWEGIQGEAEDLLPAYLGRKRRQEANTEADSDN